MDNTKAELVRSIDQHGVNLLLLQDRVETNANMLVERLYSQVQNLEELVRQHTEALEQKIETKDKSHASYHSLLQDRFQQAIMEQQAPLESLLNKLDQKSGWLTEECKGLSVQVASVREGTRVLERKHERLEVEVQVMQAKVDRSSHRRSGSSTSSSNLLRNDESLLSEFKDGPTQKDPALQSSSSSSLPSSAPGSPLPIGFDVKRVENVEAQVKRIDSNQKSLEQTLQAHQAQVEETVRDIKSKLAKHEESIALDEKDRERQRAEEKEKFKLEEKERSKLEDRMRAEMQENIDKVSGSLSTLEKLHKSIESVVQSTINQDLRDIKEEIEKNRAHYFETEEKTKLEMKDIKEGLEKLKKREKEELIEIKSKLLLANQEIKPKENPKDVQKSMQANEKEIAKGKIPERDRISSSPSSSLQSRANDSPVKSPSPLRSADHDKNSVGRSGSSSRQDEAASSSSSVKTPASPIIPKIRSDAKTNEFGEKAILWEYDPIGGKWMRLVITLRMEGKPFAEGALRHAFNAEAIGTIEPADEKEDPLSPELFPPTDQIMPLRPGDTLPTCCDARNSWRPGSKFVVKVYKKDAEQKASRELYFEDVKMQMVCRDWGNKFNQKKPPKRIEFLMAWVLELVDRSPMVLCNMEPLLIGEFKKNNSNFGAVLNTRSTPQSFSHFTYEQSRKDLIIVDIQGVEDHYTDPQIHTSDGKGYGLGNLGKNGIQRFLSTHKCNAVCALLGLTPIGMGSTRKPQLRGTMIMPDILPHLPPSDVKVGMRSTTPSEYTRKELKLVHTLQGHRDRISALCYLKAEGLVCTASADATIKVFDPANGWKCVETLTGHKKAVECLCFNSKFLFSGSGDQTIKVWDPKRDFRCVQTLVGHKGEISAICVNSKYIITGSFDKTIKIWDLETYQEIKTLESHTKSVKCLCLAGSYLFSGSNDLLIYVWDLDALMPIFSLEGHEEWVKALTMAGQSLISGSHDSTIKVWDLTEFTCMQTLKGHRDAVVALLSHGPIVYSGSEDNSIKVWDLNSLDCICTVPKAHPLGVQAFVMLDKKLVSVSVDGSIKVWEWGSK
eukprot:Phypoly_transcript_01005.p1 GENE.Phypoly_transcript_01005~~Phypoly_transcript_01005.p1  ORF type:complete len:1229 (+),score=198.16 Phypoly_transcript_01005:490-3687(+)